MSLTATQRSFLVQRLRIAPKPKNRAASGPDDELNDAVDRYLDLEKQMLQHLHQLQRWRFARGLGNAYEGEVEAARRGVAGVERSAGVAALRTASENLTAIAPRLGTAVKQGRHYETARDDAKKALEQAAPKMLDSDIAFVNDHLIERADAHADADRWTQALETIARVSPHCSTAAKADLKTRFAGNELDKLGELLRHPQRAAFVWEIEQLNKLASTMKANAGLGVANTLGYDVKLLGWYADKYIGLADAHGRFIAARDDLARRHAALRNTVELADNAAAQKQLQAVSDGLAGAGRKADKHIYESAQAALAEIGRLIDEAEQTKSRQFAWLEALRRVEPEMQRLQKQLTGPAMQLLAQEHQALQQRLEQARTMAREGHDLALAISALNDLDQDVLRLAASAQLARQNAQQALEALRQIDTDAPSALEGLRRMLAALKLRPGHEGVATLIDAAERKLGEAAEALKG